MPGVGGVPRRPTARLSALGTVGNARNATRRSSLEHARGRQRCKELPPQNQQIWMRVACTPGPLWPLVGGLGVVQVYTCRIQLLSQCLVPFGLKPGTRHVPA